MRRSTFLKRMALAAASCLFIDVPWPGTPEAVEQYTPHGMVGPEDLLSDMLYNVHPVDIPFMASVTEPHAMHVEWQTDSLRP